MGHWFRGVLRFRLLVLAAAVGLLAAGIVQLRSAPVDVLPEFSPPYAEIQTEALGLSAEEVEQLITVPLEADLLNGVEGVDVIRSDSLPGLSSIVLVFAPGTDVYRARQLVEERLTQAYALPNVSKPPTLLQPLSSSSRVLMIALSSDDLSAIEQSVIARWTVRPRLMGVPGVANVSVWGMRDQQLQVQVDPERLRRQGVTLNQVIRSAGNAQVVSPLTFLEASTPGTGGFIETPQQRLQVRHLVEKIADPQELGKVPVAGTGGRLRLRDVATIVVDHQPLIGDAVVDSGPGLMLVVEKFPGASTREVTKGVEAALEKLRPGLSGMRTDTSVFRPASYLEDAIGNIGLVLLLGGVLMLLAIATVLFRWRAVLVAAVTVPLSLVTATLLLRLFDQGLNAIALAGLAAAVAVVVDEAVAPVDRVMRQVRQRRDKAFEPSGTSLVLDALTEVRTPLVYATAIALLAVVPVAVLGGRPGAFFAPLVLAYVVAIAAAMLVALTVTPVLTALLFSRWQPTRATSPLSSRVAALYSAGLRGFTRRRAVALVAGGVAAVVGVVGLLALQSSLIPTFRERAVLVRLDAQPGTSNQRMTEVATDLARRLQALPGVEAVGAHVGRAVTGDRITDVHSSDVWVDIAGDADYGTTFAAIDDAVQDVQGLRHEVATYSTQKIRDVGALTRGDNPVTGTSLDVLTGADRPLVVRLFGENADILRREAARVQQVMSGVDGVVDPRIDLPAEQPTLQIEVDLDKALKFGITPGDVRRAEATLLQGIQVGSVFQEQKVFDVIVQGAPSTRRSVEDVRNLLLDRPGGGHLRLGQVADVRVADTPSVIRRDAVSRRLDVVAGVSGRSVDAVAADIEGRLAGIGFPREYHAEVLTASTADEIGLARFVGFAAVAAVAAFLLLQAAFRSWRLATLVFALLPLSLVGGVLAAWADNGKLSLGTLVGLLALLGLATRTATLYVANVQSLERAPVVLELAPHNGHGPDDERGRHAGGRTAHTAAVLLGARRQLAPVLASTAAVGALVLPIVVLGPRPGLEVLHPMAVAVLGGLVTCALVTLFLLPALHLQLPPQPVSADEEAALRPADLGGGTTTAATGPERRHALEHGGETVR